MKKIEYFTTREKVDVFETTISLLNSMYDEFKEFSKKKPDAPVNEKKIEIVNRLLHSIRIVLKDEKAIEYLDILDKDDIPQMDFIVITLSQYLAAMNAFKQKYHGWNGTEHTWFTK